MKSTLIAITLLAAVARAAPTYPYDGAYPQDLQDDQGFNDDSDLQYGAPQQNQPDVDAPTPSNSFNARRTQSSGQLQQYGAAQPEEQQYYANNPLARQSYDDAYPQDYQRQQPALRQHSNGPLAFQHPSLPRKYASHQQQEQPQPQQLQQLQQQYSSVPRSNSAPAQQYQQQQAVTQDPYDAAEQSESEDFEFQDPQQQAPAPQQGSQAGQVAVAGGASVAGASAGTAGSVPVQQPPQQQEGSSDFDEAFKAVCPGLFGKTKTQIATALYKARSIFAACQSDADVQQPQQPSAGASATTEQRSAAEPAAQQSTPSSSGQAPQEPAKKGFLANLFKW
ncbi:hypothetical protein MP228_007453 [Amoeboaphelidium protococcarum]|nr:hypothetical protein MP228_007453 [Amoeboaphelidium protococcarum]